MSDFRLRAERSSAAGVRGAAEPPVDGWRARWLLARWWVGRSALSYLTTALLVLVVSPLIGFSLDVVVRGEDVPEFLIDGCFLLPLANLAVNWTSTNYVFVGDDYFSGRVSFLRGLPTSAKDIVGMRLLVLVATLLVMTTLAFLPPYLIFEVVRETFGPYRYLCFVVLWASYGLVCGCAVAYLELGFRARSMLIAMISWSVALLVLLLLVSASGGGIVEGSVRLILSHGKLVAGLALASGAGGAYLWYRLAERRVRGRELSA